MFRRKRTDADFHAEIATHIAFETDRLVEEGMAPEDARRVAMRRFGNVASAQERFYESRRVLFLDHFIQDLRYALRGLRAHPSFTAVAIFTLALGIGANTAIFSVLKAVLLEPLPYRNPGELVHIIQNLAPSQTIDARPRRMEAMDLHEFIEVRKHTHTLASLEAYDTNREVTLNGAGEPVRAIATAVSAALFSALGVQPGLGRNFLPEEERPGAQSVILSHAAWQKYFASDAGILNRPLAIDGLPRFVVGVMPQSFAFPDHLTEFWTPLDLTQPPQLDIRSVIPLGRLRTGNNSEAAASEANAIIENFRRAYPQERALSYAKLEFVTMKDELVRPVQSALVVLTIAVGFVLLIACSNVANLLLARGAARQGEHAVRAALGASRGRLIQQTLTESCLLAILGGVAGCFVAFAGIQLLKELGGDTIPRLNEVRLDFGVLYYTLGLSALTGVLFGLIPALQWSRGNEMQVMKSVGGRSSQRTSFQGFFVVAEVGLAVVLLIGGGLLLRSFVKLSRVDPGFDPTNVLMFQVAMPQPQAPAAMTESQTQTVLSRIQSLPGVQSAGYANAAPMVPRLGFSAPRIEGTPIPVPGQPEFRQVSRDYFSTMGIRVIAGRGFAEDDGPGQPRVVIVNRAMIPFFAGESPIGKAITLAGNRAEIIGIIDDTHEQALSLEPRPQVFLDSRQNLNIYKNAQALFWAYFVVRADRDPAALISSVQRTVRETIPGATLKLNTATMEEIIYRSIARPRLYTLLLGIFGAVAVLLAAVGVYGITAYSVAHRTREIGIRIALGAQRRAVLGVALRRTISLCTLGIVIGLAGAAVLTRYLQGMLFGLTPLDPATFAAIPASFEVTALLASYLPARRAMKVDPVVALRQE